MVVSGFISVSCVMPPAHDFYFVLRPFVACELSLFLPVTNILRKWMLTSCALSGPFVPTGSGKRELVEQLEVFRLGVPSGEVRGGECERGRLGST